MVATPELGDRRPGTRPPLAVRRLADDTRIIFLSDSHIGGDAGHDIFESPEELTALLDEITALPGPVELVLAGDFFDFLEIGEVPEGEDRAAMTIARPEYRALFAALRRFAAGPAHHVVYLPGNHDAEAWWNPAIQATLRGNGLVHEVVLAYAARFASQPERIIYCEHGNQLDPANAITDYDDPLDTPLGHHIVTDITRRIVPAGAAGGNQALRDINKVYPLVAIPDWLAGRLFYELLTQIGRWLLLPLLLAYTAFRVVASLVAAGQDAPLSFWESPPSLAGGQQWFIEIGYNAALLLTAFAVCVVVIRRLTARAVESTSEHLPGLDQSAVTKIRGLLDSDRPLPMSNGLTGRDISLIVTGHTHAAALSEVTRRTSTTALVINSGCWLRQLRPVPAHFGAPSVFVSTFVLTHVRVFLDGGTIRAELWEQPKPARRRLRLAERIATLGRLPTVPAASAASRTVAAAGLRGVSPGQSS